MMSGKRQRFTADDDILLLREVATHNPLADPAKWLVVQENVEKACGKLFSMRSLKDHLLLLLELWLKKDKETQIRSGVEEAYSERDVLLQEINDLKNDASKHVKQKVKPTKKESDTALVGKGARDMYAFEYITENENLLPSCSGEHSYAHFSKGEESMEVAASEEWVAPSVERDLPVQENITPKRIIKRKVNTARGARKAALEFLNERVQREYSLKQKELQLEEKRLALEEKKLNLQQQQFELQRYEIHEKLRMEAERFKCEIQERTRTHELLQQQQNVTDILLKRLQTYEAK